MKHLLFFSTFVGLLVARGFAAEPSPDASLDPSSLPAGKHVLIVTGIDYPGHPWRETAPLLKRFIEADARLKARVIEDPKALASAALNKWDLIVLHFMNWEVPGPGEDARENLKRVIAAGKGLMLTHFACGAWQEWPDFRKLAGRVWDPKLRPHDPLGTFQVQIADNEHPITRTMKPFETVDELYTCLTGDAPIHVLLNATSKVDQKVYPLAFTVEYGSGKVFHTVLGHDGKAYTNSPSMAVLLRRGAAWAAGLEPK